MTTTTPSTEVIFMVAKNGYGTEPSIRFSTYEEAEKKFIEFVDAGYTDVVIIAQRMDEFEIMAMAK